MKICFIAQFPPPIHGLSKAVDTLYTSELSDMFELEKINITNCRHFIKNLLLIKKSKAELFYFTISQTKGGNLRDLIILKVLELQHKKCLIHLHGGYYRQLVDDDLPEWQRRANYKAIGKLVGAIVLSPSLRLLFEGMLPNEKIFVVSNCVDDQYLMSDDEFNKKVNELPTNSVRNVLYLSNFIRTKGYLDVLEMALMEKEKCEAGRKQEFYFHFAGKFLKKTDEQQFIKYIKKNQLEKYVAYHGIVTGKKKQDLLKKCDIFMLLTRYPREGQPISILEAMGNGMVVVTTNHAGIADVVEDGINGILIDKNKMDIEQCYEEIRSKSAADMQKIIQTNRKAVKWNYIQSIYIERIHKIMNLCCHSASS